MNLGKFQQIDLRDYWENEATNFTPWLAAEENIALLSEAIGIDIEVEGTEVSIGSFKADILGRDSNNNNKIIIENQLEKSNHDHLGKIITYASGVDASVVIWICSKITDEHRQAIEWLNENTNESINFFAIEIELWKIDDSNPAPRFNIICKPNEWTKTTRVYAESKGWTREMWKERATWTVETADCLFKLISGAGVFENLDLRYTASYISIVSSDPSQRPTAFGANVCFSLEKRGDENKSSLSFPVNDEQRDELKELLEKNNIQYKTSGRYKVLILVDEEFIEKHKEIFIRIAKFIKAWMWG